MKHPRLFLLLSTVFSTALFFVSVTAGLPVFDGIAFAETSQPDSAVPCVDNFADQYPCANVDLLANLPLTTFNSVGASDLWGWVDSQTGEEWALVAFREGTAFVNVTDPLDPAFRAWLPTATRFRVQRDIKTANDYAFIVSESLSHGMQIVDLAILRTLPATTTTIAATAHYTGFNRAHNVIANPQNPSYVVAVGAHTAGITCSGGLHIVNVENPVEPRFAGCFSADGYTHDAQCVTYSGPDSDYTGREICFAANTDSLTIVDITDSANPIQLSRTTDPSLRYLHQGWLTADSRYFVANDERDEQALGHNTRTLFWDVADLDAPTLFHTYEFSTASSDHNLYVHRNYAYLANYSSGLRILDLTDLADRDAHEVAWFDTYPDNDNANFNGAWTAYPYLPSGNILVNSREGGLFVLKPNLVNTPTVVGLRGISAEMQPYPIHAAFILLAAFTICLYTRKKKSAPV